MPHGANVALPCRHFAIARSTFYRWQRAMTVRAWPRSRTGPHQALGYLTPAEFLGQLGSG
jgi:hypothetical protein